ncbi:Hypothetical predicted protein [Olea europaea subsp. europaea]|uniref:Uncharacterized protein n=1 Tax=Olea europaea subsp. europaea TaxID=158383 RepID=A0A8S0Q4T9_OLEEU|nr:Hypothetical predicted protein [Olea europaea subsp. europaea]
MVFKDINAPASRVMRAIHILIQTAEMSKNAIKIHAIHKEFALILQVVINVHARVDTLVMAEKMVMAAINGLQYSR